MATRSLKLKLVIPRDDSPESREVREALWRTHEFVNDCVRHYELLLLELRQRDTVLERDANGVDVVTTREEWSDRLRGRILKYCSRGATQDDLDLLRRLYELMVPSAGAEAEAGGAGSDVARGYHSALVTRESKAGQANSVSDDCWRRLVGLAEDAVAFSAAARDLAVTVPEAIQRTGAPPRWKRLMDQGDEEWVEVAREWVKKTFGDREPDLRVILRDRGLLPVALPFGSGIVSAGDGLSTIERMAFGLAVDHLLSFESWEKRTHKQYEERVARLEQWDADHGDSCADGLRRIRAFEQAYGKELSDVAFWSEGSAYRIGLRELRVGWERLREWLRKHPEAENSEAEAEVKRLQGELGRAFGAERLLRWLAHRDQRGLTTAPVDVVTLVAVRNTRQSVLERTRRLPLFTCADARLHPRFVALDAPPNTNSPQYDLQKAGETGSSLLVAGLPLLVPKPDGQRFGPRRFDLKLAPSEQALSPTVRRVAKGVKQQLLLTTVPQDRVGDPVTFPLGGANLLFERRRLEHRDPARLRAGEFGGVYLKLSVTVGEEFEEELKRRRKIRQWLSSGPAKRRATLAAAPGAGTRCLAIDLGIRTAVSGSVFELREARGSGPAAWPLPPSEAGLALQHCRSFQARLPGEQPTTEVRERRDRAVQQWRELRAALNRLRMLAQAVRLGDPALGAAVVQRMLETPEGEANAIRPDRTALERLVALSADAEAFQGAARLAWNDFRTNVAHAFKEWRAAQRAARLLPARQRTLGGKSMWAIEQIERQRKLLMAWNRVHPPDDVEVRRLDRERQGIFAGRLLRHLNSLKEDRAKTTADLIVQSARGLVYQDGAWLARHAPVDLIVLEDLSRFRMRTDRPRSENSQLMRWAHREIARRVEEQAEAYGMVVATTPASFTSRFDSVTKAPGVRCRRVTADYLEFLRSPSSLGQQARFDRLGIDVDRLADRDLVPHDGGPVFVAIDPSTPGGLRIKDADINAAQNIAKRFLERDSQVFRCVTRKVSGDGVRVSTLFGKDSLNAYGFGGRRVVFTPLGDGPGLRHQAFQTNKAAAAYLGVGLESLGADAADDAADSTRDDALDAEELAAEAALASLAGDREVLFRDLSGAVFGGLWVEAKIFWGRVAQEVTRRLRAPVHNGHPRLHG